MLTVFVSHGSALLSMDPLCDLHVNLGAAGRRLLQTAATRNPPLLTGIVVNSGHYQAGASSSSYVTVSSRGVGSHWGTMHDHPAQALFGFKYTAETCASLGEQVRLALVAAGLDARDDDSSKRRELDHGAWVALHSLWPDQAPCPVVQVSLHGGGVEDNFHLGQCLAAGLSSRGVILVASGGLTHNQDEFRRSFFRDAPAAPLAELADWSEGARERRRQGVRRAESSTFAESVAFDAIARSAVEEGRAHVLLRAHDEAPDFARVHPEPSHWLPLIVALGAAHSGSDGSGAVCIGTGTTVHQGFQHGLSETAFLWDGAAGGNNS